MFTQEYAGSTWGIVYLNTDTRLTDDERDDIVIEAIKMYYGKHHRRKLKGERYEGLMWSDGDEKMLNVFSGRPYKAEVEIEGHRHKAKLEFLVTKYTGISMN